MPKSSTAILAACGEHYVAAYLSGPIYLIVALPRAGVRRLVSLNFRILSPNVIANPVHESLCGLLVAAEHRKILALFRQRESLESHDVRPVGHDNSISRKLVIPGSASTSRSRTSKATQISVIRTSS